MKGQKNKEFNKLPDYLPWMISYARRLVAEADAEDLAIIALNKAYHSTRPPPAINDSKQMQPWLAALMRLVAFSFWRLKKRRRSREVFWDEPAEEAEVPMQLDLEATIETRECLRVVLNRLSERHRDLIWRHEVEEVPLSVLANEYGVNVRTVQLWLNEARDELRRKYLASQTIARSRLRMFFPVWFRLSWSDESVEHESWLRRAWSRLVQMVRHAWPWAAPGALALVCTGLVPRGLLGELQNEPAAIAIAPEPVRSAAVVLPVETTQVAPGAKMAESSGVTASTAAVAKPTALRRPSKATATKQAIASDEDDSLLLYAKAALNRGDAKQAFDNVREHERRFPNSPNARQRERLRETIEEVMADKR